MTEPAPSSLRTPRGSDSPTAAATPAVQREHAADRLDHWQDEQAKDSRASRKRFWFIAAVVVIAVGGWIYWAF